jgi:hypothetical protein
MHSWVLKIFLDSPDPDELASLRLEDKSVEELQQLLAAVGMEEGEGENAEANKSELIQLVQNSLAHSLLVGAFHLLLLPPLLSLLFSLRAPASPPPFCNFLEYSCVFLSLTFSSALILLQLVNPSLSKSLLRFSMKTVPPLLLTECLSVLAGQESLHTQIYSCFIFPNFAQFCFFFFCCMTDALFFYFALVLFRKLNCFFILSLILQNLMI